MNGVSNIGKGQLAIPIRYNFEEGCNGFARISDYPRYATKDTCCF